MSQTIHSHSTFLFLLNDEQVFFALGEEFDTKEKNICGIMWTLNEGRSRIAIWLAYSDSKSDEAKTMKSAFKEALHVEADKPLAFRLHINSYNHAKGSGPGTERRGDGGKGGHGASQQEKKDDQQGMFESAEEIAAMIAKSAEEKK